jgi:hypothetical protein
MHKIATQKRAKSRKIHIARLYLYKFQRQLNYGAKCQDCALILGRRQGSLDGGLEGASGFLVVLFLHLGRDYMHIFIL